MLETGESAPLEAAVWPEPGEPVTLADLLGGGPILLLFYLFDWTGT